MPLDKPAIQARCSKVVDSDSFLSALGNRWEGEFRSIDKCWTRFGEVLTKIRFTAMKTEPMLRGCVWNEVGGTSGVLALQTDGNAESPLPPGWTCRPLYAIGMGHVDFLLADSMQTRVVWAHHEVTTGTMRIFNSAGRLVMQSAGGEGLGTLEPGWLERRRVSRC